MGDSLRFFSSHSPDSSRGHGYTHDTYGPEFAGPWGEPGMYSQDDYIQMARDELERLISTDGPTTSWLYSDYYSQPPQGGNYGPGLHPSAPQPPLQPELKVGAVNDPLEKEADEVAERVMRDPRECYLDPPVSPFQPKPVGERISAEKLNQQDEEVQSQSLQRNLAGMDEDAKETLGYTHAFEKSDAEEDLGTTTSLYMQRDAKGPGVDGGPVSPFLEERIQSVRNTGGKKLPESEREFFESRMGHDFGDVRIHTGSEAAQVSRDVNAKAFAIGRELVFGEGEYKPGTPEGRRLMAHELTHTVQQGAAGEIRREGNAKDLDDKPLTDGQSYSWGDLVIDPRKKTPGMLANVKSLYNAVARIYGYKSSEKIHAGIQTIVLWNPWIKDPNKITNLKPVLLPSWDQILDSKTRPNTQVIIPSPSARVKELPGGKLAYEISLDEAKIQNQPIKVPGGTALVDIVMGLKYSIIASAGIPLTSGTFRSKDSSTALAAVAEFINSDAKFRVEGDLQDQIKFAVIRDGAETFSSFSLADGFPKFTTGVAIPVKNEKTLEGVGRVSISGKLAADIGVTVKGFAADDLEPVQVPDVPDINIVVSEEEVVVGTAIAGAAAALLSGIAAAIWAIAAP